MSMDRTTGRMIDYAAHIEQSIRDILTTRIGTRIRKRAYGCRIIDIIDEPLTESTILDMYAAVAEALERWEPRFRLEKTTISGTETGQATINIYGQDLVNGKELTIEGLSIS